MLFGLLTNACFLFATSSASALIAHPFLGDICEPTGLGDPPCQPNFTSPAGLAVDQSTGDLLVINVEEPSPHVFNGFLSRYHQDGTPADFSALNSTNVIDGHPGELDETPEGEILRSVLGSPGELQVAVDNSGGATEGDIYVTNPHNHVIDIFASTGEHIGQLTESSEGELHEPCGVAVDPSGNLYVGDFGGTVHKYEPSANPPVNGDNSNNFGFGGNCTLAAGAAASEGFIFPAHFLGSVSKLEGTSPGEEKYEVDPGPTTTVTVDPASGFVYIASGSEVREYDASGASEAETLTPISQPGKVTGIAVDQDTGHVYVAREGGAQIEVWGPAVALPEATTTSASVVGANVTMRGVVSAAEGPPATCVFEYVEIHAKAFQGANSVPCSPAGPFTGNSPASVSADVNGLPEAGYRYRLVASNENGSNSGKPLLFNTFERIPGLPDSRAYEMVSPSQKLGEVIPPEPSVSPLGGTCGECLPALSLQIMPMQSAPDGDAVLYEGQPFSGGLASSVNEYIANRGAGGWATRSLSEPLFGSILGQGYQAFSTDLSRGVLYQAEPALSPEAPTREGKGFANLYLRDTDGLLQPLVVQEPPNRDPGLPQQFQNQFQVTYGGANSGTSNATAFSHIVFQANDALTGEVPGIAPEAPEVEEAGEECSKPGTGCNLYEWLEGQLRLVNILPGNTSSASGAVLGSGRLQALQHSGNEGADADHAISADGSRIFWSEEANGQLYVRIGGEETKKINDPGLFLTAMPSGSKVLLSDGCLYDLAEEKCEADLSQGQGEKFEGILGAAENLSRIYFVDTAVLTGSDENANREHAEEGEFNLYAWHEGETSFIGTLLEKDNLFGNYGDWVSSRSSRTAQVSADGSYLAFMSHASLTGFDSNVSGGGECVSNGGPACVQVFVYAANSGSLTCASCNPSGEQPIGPSNLSLIKGPTSFLPFPQPGNLSPAGGGRLFFESQDALSPRDTNGKVTDVYEWEPNGVGSCKRAAGCVYLISSGTSANDSMFLDSTPSGNDAFFITRQQLLPPDRNDQLDLYDARVGGGFNEPTTAPCEGEACKGPASSPPPIGAPGSQEFSGPGNPPKQKKPPKKHKKHHKKHHRGSSK